MGGYAGKDFSDRAPPRDPHLEFEIAVLGDDIRLLPPRINPGLKVSFFSTSLTPSMLNSLAQDIRRPCDDLPQGNIHGVVLVVQAVHVCEERHRFHDGTHSHRGIE